MQCSSGNDTHQFMYTPVTQSTNMPFFSILKIAQHQHQHSICVYLSQRKNKPEGLAPVYHAVGLRCWTRGHSLINYSRQTKTKTKTVGNRGIFLRMLGGRVWEVFSSGESSTAEAGSEGHIQESAVTKVWSINALYALFCLFFNRTIDRQCSILVTWLRCDKRALGNK